MIHANRPPYRSGGAVAAVAVAMALHGCGAGSPTGSSGAGVRASEIVVAVNPRGNSDLLVLDVDTGRMRQLTSDPDSADETPTVSRDGRTVYFYRGMSGTMWRIGIDGSDRRPVSRSGIGHLDFHEDVGTISGIGFRLTLAPLGGGLDIPLTDPPAGQADSKARFSPDGTLIAFARGGGPTHQELWVMSSDGSSKRKIGERIDAGAGLSWHPDQTSIAAVFPGGQPGDPRGGVYSYAVDGSGRTPLTDAARAVAPEWSPDGRTLLFRGGDVDDGFMVAVMNPDGSPRVIEEGAGMKWAPDGSRFAYCRWVDGVQAGIAVANRDGSGVRFIFSQPSQCGLFAWVPK